MLVRWDEKYRVGNDQIDQEHQYLFELMNAFYDGYLEKRDRAQLLILLNRLVDYAQRHFRNEEALMKSSGYADVEAHSARHEKLVEQVFDLNTRLSDRAFNPEHDTVAFLKGWLTDHIVHQDLLLGAHLNAGKK